MNSINSSVVKLDNIHDKVLEKAAETLGNQAKILVFQIECKML